MIRSLTMDSDLEKDNERDWFEPVELQDGPEFMSNFGPLASVLQPDKRAFLLVGLILLTFFGGLSAGAFELRDDATEPESSSGTAVASASPVSAEQALRNHLEKLDISQEPASKPAPSNETNKPSDKEKAIVADEPSDDKKADTEAEVETVSLADSLELGSEALRSKDWNEAAEHFERASKAWTKKKSGKAWREMRYGLSKAHYKNKKPSRAVEILEALRQSDSKWDKPLLLLGLAAKNAKEDSKAVKYLSMYLEEGGTKTAKVCPYLDEQDAVDEGSQEVQEACSLED